MVNMLEKVKLGGVNQWILAKGNKEENPILLFLHGGPGLPMMPLYQYFQSKLEDEYIVVHWDQRGTGKSFSEDISPYSMNLSQILLDAHELISILKEQFGKEKIYIAGHSWGSILGINLIKFYPESFYGFISVGQIVNFLKAMEFSYDFVLKEGNKQGHREVIRELIDIKNLANNDDLRISTILKHVKNFGGNMHNEINFSQITKQCKIYTKEDLKNISKGLEFSERYLWNEVVNTNIMDKIVDIKVPIYFLCGKYDYVTPSVLIEEYYNKINAPSKTIVLFNESAHYPYIEEPHRFSEEIIKVKKFNEEGHDYV